ncbi:hypothetical protein BESB_074630 [Besnoitia besnoiti]|uniref:Uncharacterized protein n=1 Tax=Besnoitia besnoiti TaxID=94643 RepID=A0A2A9MDE4_BESBE|nr:uncharacterized protein BESB_074630 [Besnoitia besnoiti]PFH34311.1 hypothetical protein BESB_074630 [Besnoitia besnoiti]
MTADWGRDSLPQDERGVLNGIPSVTEPSQFPRYFQTEAAAMPEGGPAWLYAGWQQRPHAVLDNILVAADRIALYDALRATSTDVAPQLLILAKSTAPIGVEALQALVSEIELGKDKKKGKRALPEVSLFDDAECLTLGTLASASKKQVSAWLQVGSTGRYVEPGLGLARGASASAEV